MPGRLRLTTDFLLLPPALASTPTAKRGEGGEQDCQFETISNIPAPVLDQNTTNNGTEGTDEICRLTFIHNQVIMGAESIS